MRVGMVLGGIAAAIAFWLIPVDAGAGFLGGDCGPAGLQWLRLVADDGGAGDDLVSLDDELEEDVAGRCFVRSLPYVALGVLAAAGAAVVGTELERRRPVAPVEPVPGSWWDGQRWHLPNEPPPPAPAHRPPT